MGKPVKTTTIISPVVHLISTLGSREAAAAMAISAKAERLERRWVKTMKDRIKALTDEMLAHAKATGRLKPSLVDFSDLVMEHSYAVVAAGMISALEPDSTMTRLSAPPTGRIPRSLKDLREWWDAYRRTRRTPARQKKIAEDLKKEFLDQLQGAWRINSEDFLSGKEANMERAIAEIRRRADVASSRATMMVETETTHYFNRGRRRIFDSSPDVSHYLFVAIRDHATTKWCKTRQGLVYAKSDPLLDKETPPCHWRCRSELLPLSRHNANHLRLIQDAARQRRNNSPEPLPEGWTARG